MATATLILVETQINLHLNGNYMTREVFYRLFRVLHFIINCIGGRAQASCNLVFVLQLLLEHKFKASKDSESCSEGYSERNT